MLTRFGCEGYRAFQAPTEISASRLTVIFGKNNSGKTTLTRLPLFLASSIGEPELYSLTNGNIRFGASFRDLANFEQPHPAISYWLETDTPAKWGVRLQSVLESLDETIHLTRLETRDHDFIFPISEWPSELQLGRVTDEGLHWINQARDDVARSLEGLLHIPSARPDIATIYEARPPVSSSVEEAPYWLYRDKRLREEVSEWLRVNLDGLTVELDHTDYGFRLTTGDATRPVNFASAGRGSQAILPVVTLLKAVTLRQLRPPLIVLEEPEAHLHPSAHAAVAELVAEASAHTQVLAETHSENFILRLRRKVADSDLVAESLRLIYVDEDREVTTIDVERNGAVSAWPEGVFEYDVEEARAIVQARLRSMKTDEL